MKLEGIAIATAALGLMLAGGAALAAGESHEGEVKCVGINSCKGQSSCAAVDGSHGCAGKNSCKGKGWLYTESEKACQDKGGTVAQKD